MSAKAATLSFTSAFRQGIMHTGFGSGKLHQVRSVEMRRGNPFVQLRRSALTALVTVAGAGAAAAREAAIIERPFRLPSGQAGGDGVELTVARATIERWSAVSDLQLALPLSAEREVVLDLSAFSVTTPQTKFLVGGRARRAVAPSDVVLLRGRIARDAQSRAFLAMSPRGVIHGEVTAGDGERFVVSGRRAPAAADELGLTVRRAARRQAVPDFSQPCGVTEAHDRRVAAPVVAGITVTHGPQVAFVAVDADQAYVHLHPDEASAQDYVVEVIGAISDIYMRDLDVKLILSFVRLWPNGGEPFSATDLGGFAEYWVKNEDATGLNLVHLFSGRRDTGYGGIAEVGGFCPGPVFGISAFMLGGFPTPIDAPDLGNWDVVVSAHEMGHNLGTYHTHDGYTPPIDNCGNTGAFALSEIMSYCHTTPGGLLNIEMRFSTRVQNVIAAQVAFEGCLWFDCNGNNANDLDDIAGPVSDDDNGNSIPDECEDCDGDGTLDDAEIASGAADANGNGIPDPCEADCNANGLPDEYETANSLTPDANGNRVPDACEPDCDQDGTADFAEIKAAGSTADIDRDRIPDSCIDCNANALRDWVDIARADFVYVADLADRVRVFHSASGVGEANFGVGSVLDPNDVVFGPDRKLYVASLANHRIVRIDTDAGTSVDFVTAGSGGLNNPAGLLFHPNGDLLVSSRGTHAVLRYDGGSGAFMGAFVTTGSGGLSGPLDLAFDANGDLLVAASNNSVLKYSGIDGSFLGAFIPANSGGLSGPRQMLVKPDGSLLVASELSNNILEYDGDGEFVGQFNDEYPLGSPTGLTSGPNGNVYVVQRGTSPIRIVEYDMSNGRYIRSFIRGDTALVTPTAFAFRPPTPNVDCNANHYPDDCDISEGASNDENSDNVPDECQLALPTVLWDPADGATRSLIVQAQSAGPSTSALKVTLVDLDNPVPANNNPPGPCCPPGDFTLFDTALNAVCSGGDNQGYRCTSDGDCPGGACPAAVGCAADGEANACARWVGPPAGFLESNDNPGLGNYRAARLQCSPFYHDWAAQGEFAILGAEIVPSAIYEVQAYAAVCQGIEATCFQTTAAVAMTTRRAGDLATAYQTTTPPLTQPNAIDVTNAVNKFRNLAGSPPKVVSQVQPNFPDPNSDINAIDIVTVVDNQRGFGYTYSGPCICPSTVPCDTTACAGASACTGLYGAGATCIKTCSSGPRTGQPCNNNLNCGACIGGPATGAGAAGIPCDANTDCASGDCGLGTCPSGATPGFCRDRCGRCN